MSADIANCPFCGASEGAGHKSDCWFELRYTGADRVNLDAAWNRRATPSPAPTGYKLAPLEPTDEQLATLDHPEAAMRRIYKAMVGPAASPAPIQQSQPVRYEQRMRAPNGHCAPWSETDAEMHERYTKNPSIGDGFTYETRALIVAPTVKASQ